MASKNKFVCPDCGSPVYGWVEEVIEHRAAVDPKTGRFRGSKPKPQIFPSGQQSQYWRGLSVNTCFPT
ncbi:hypothetical protein ASA01S_156_00010 [Aeromonas salmonicida subsp. masoucida NBRC 13784]|nr:hypothetical protein ASA01S_156_00010 [Aeromonas salmonicida subsp. masoucida NBRC 13784]